MKRYELSFYYFILKEILFSCSWIDADECIRMCMHDIMFPVCRYNFKLTIYRLVMLIWIKRTNSKEKRKYILKNVFCAAITRHILVYVFFFYFNSTWRLREFRLLNRIACCFEFWYWYWCIFSNFFVGKFEISDCDKLFRCQKNRFWNAKWFTNMWYSEKKKRVKKNKNYGYMIQHPW